MREALFSRNLYGGTPSPMLPSIGNILFRYEWRRRRVLGMPWAVDVPPGGSPEIRAGHLSRTEMAALLAIPLVLPRPPPPPADPTADWMQVGIVHSPRRGDAL